MPPLDRPVCRRVDAHACAAVLELIRDLLTEAVQSGKVRDDVAPEELASYCLHALGAAGTLPSEDAVHRLVTVTLAALRS